MQLETTNDGGRDDGPCHGGGDRDAALREVLAGLERSPKRIPSKFLYDARGSRLFDRITELPEYYPTRTELAILRERAGEIAAVLGPRCMLIEPGAGTAEKASILVAAMEDPAAFVPVEISANHLRELTEEMRERFPQVEILPVCADFTQPFEWSPPSAEVRSRAAFLPGSTLGNLDRDQRVSLLRRLAEIVGGGGAVVLGVDLRKDERMLVPAYDDAQGVTAEFNLNALRHLNNLLGSDFDLSGFEHRAVFNADEQRIEMHLVSQRDQVVHLGDREVAIAGGESIVTEHSNKFDIGELESEAAEAGLGLEASWTDSEGRFAELLLRAAA